MLEQHWLEGQGVESGHRGLAQVGMPDHLSIFLVTGVSPWASQLSSYLLRRHDSFLQAGGSHASGSA